MRCLEATHGAGGDMSYLGVCYSGDVPEKRANAGFMLGQRRRRWPNIKTTLAQRLVLFWWRTAADSCPGVLNHWESPPAAALPRPQNDLLNNLLTVSSMRIDHVLIITLLCFIRGAIPPFSAGSLFALLSADLDSPIMLCTSQLTFVRKIREKN